MNQASRVDLPEGAQIRDLLGQLNGNGKGKGKAADKGRSRRPRPVRGVVFGGTPLFVALGRINWGNDPTQAQELATLSVADRNGDIPCLRGGLGVRTVMNLINWGNAPTPPAWPVREGAGTPVGLQNSVENWLGGWQWGD